MAASMQAPTLFVLAADLVTKWLAFRYVTGEPILLSRTQKDGYNEIPYHEGIELIPALRAVVGVEEIPVILVDAHRRASRSYANGASTAYFCGFNGVSS